MAEGGERRLITCRGEEGERGQSRGSFLLKGKVLVLIEVVYLHANPLIRLLYLMFSYHR